MKFKLIYTVATLLLFNINTTPARAWGDRGHAIIWRFASNRLTPKTRAAIESIRTHQSNVLPPPETYYESLIPSYYEQRRILDSFPAQPAKREKALNYLIRIVGDIHQPTHCVRDPRNRMTHLFLWAPATLDRVWDNKLIDVMSYGYTVNEYADKIDAAFVPRDDGGPEDWARESRCDAAEYVYGKMGVFNFYIRNQAPAPMNYRDLNLHYLYWSKGVVNQHLQNAGARLARVLNESLDTGWLLRNITHPAGPAYAERPGVEIINRTFLTGLCVTPLVALLAWLVFGRIRREKYANNKNN